MHTYFLKLFQKMEKKKKSLSPRRKTIYLKLWVYLQSVPHYPHYQFLHSRNIILTRYQAATLPIKEPVIPAINCLLFGEKKKKKAFNFFITSYENLTERQLCNKSCKRPFYLHKAPQHLLEFIAEVYIVNISEEVLYFLTCIVRR